MKYLFYDIECSNCDSVGGKMCEFGYIITDENFNILCGDDVPMSPGDKWDPNVQFDKGIYERDPKFRYGYSEEEYFSFPKFPKYYSLIRSLLTNELYMVFGFAVYNDIGYLDSTINMYKKQRFNYVAFDVQSLVNGVLKTTKEKPGLEKTFIDLLGVNERVKYQAHCPMDDAKMTMVILKELCKISGKSPIELTNLYANSKYYVFDYLEQKKIQHKKKQVAKKLKYKRQFNHKQWAAYCEEHKSENEQAMKITISKRILEDTQVTKETIKLVCNLKLKAVDNLNICDLFLVINQEEKDELSKIFNPTTIEKIIMLDELRNMNENKKRR